ncbi:MAG TPA: hypothetical protein VJH69_01890 [Candidatus Paceibacterota bacterium]
MIKTILFWMLGLLLLSFIIVWLWTGGISKASIAAQSPTNLIDMLFFGGTSTGKTLKLPWQPDMPTFPTMEDQQGTYASMVALENQGQPIYENYSDEQSTEAAKNFGNPSPLRGQVVIAQTYGAKEFDPSAEYIIIGASSANTAPTDITGWSVQSAYTGARGYIPRSASPFVMGNINNPEATILNPGAVALINSGPSPVGISFRENICTGYLGQFQNFYPSLANSCPSPRAQLSLNEQNLRAYGDTCFDFLDTVPTCTSPFQSIPPNISANCRNFALNQLSYNGCVAKNAYGSGFAFDTWRIYLGFGTELWRNSHDIIRLLDSGGRTVDVYTY